MTRQIGERERIIDGRAVRVRVMQAREPGAAERETQRTRDDSRRPWQRWQHGLTSRGARER